MSLADRLFPASERDALRKYSSGKDGQEEQPAKRRRLGSTHSVFSTATSAGDSGYNSEDGSYSKLSPTLPELETSQTRPAQKHIQVPVSNQKRQRVNSEPSHSVRVPTELTQTSVSCMLPAGRQQDNQSRPWPPQRAPSSSLPRPRDADLEIISAQHQIALARQRLHSYSGPTPTTHQDQRDLGYTAGPKAAGSLSLFTRLFDGCRIMNHERNLFDSLFESPHSAVELGPQPEPATDAPVQLTFEDRKEVEQVVNYAGFAMPVILDDDEEDAKEAEPQLDMHDGEIANHTFEDFFNLDEASTPGEGRGS